ncbi:MAG: hypothetical protein HQM09_19110 [Candidatus Riflebacteria bacterium]|nr:hypothetical protein [Candidatus Riflebacteria bacterium]
MLTDNITSVMTSFLTPKLSTGTMSDSIATGNNFSKSLELATSSLSTPPSVASAVDLATSSTAGGEKTKAADGQNDPANFGGLAYNFSFFMRLSGDIGKLGKDVLSQFQDTTEHIGTKFLQQSDWRGDPVGSYLQGTQKALQEGFDGIKSYLGSLMASSTSGFSSLASSLGSSIPASSSSMSSAENISGLSPQSIPFSCGNAAYEIARLRLSEASSSQGININNLCQSPVTSSTGNTSSATSSASGSTSSSAAIDAGISSSTTSGSSKSYLGHNLIKIDTISASSSANGGKNLKIIQVSSATNAGSLRTDPLPAATSPVVDSTTDGNPSAGSSSDPLSHKFLEVFIQFIRKLRENSPSDQHA